ncbi:MAG: glucans biosynthesis protein [Verrucomicrobia bacterium]|nr:MAG: glucans biosynthesis protein [Verrucomicrobiota bacterium]
MCWRGAACIVGLTSLSLTARGAAGTEIERVEVTFDYVAKLAERRANAEFKEPDRELPRRLAEIDYDQMRAIRFLPEQALWRKESLPFHLHLFHRTRFHREAITIREFSPTHVQTVPFIREFFDYGRLENLGALRSSLGYSGFRLHYPLNRPEVFDEAIVFHGASYFRALGAGQVYGLSARGLAINSAIHQVPEEFPVFTDFWVGKPSAGANQMRIYGLLDSRSVAGAYEFLLRPGRPTMVTVRARLFPRAAMETVGIAPLTSMFWFGKNADRPQGDPRPQVHDSDGLIVHGERGARLWRPLQNPRFLLNTDIRVENLTRFGLLQREREISAYEDFEALYHRRPSLWIEPIGDWGAGRVRLAELPTRDEYGDNVVAYWIPDKNPAPGQGFDFSYKMVWSLEEPGGTALARVDSTRIGHLPGGGRGQLFWIDFTGGSIGQFAPPSLSPEIVLGAGAQLRHQTLIRHPGNGGWRVALQVEAVNPPPPEGEELKPIELRVRLRDGYNPVSETWVYTWLP